MMWIPAVLQKELGGAKRLGSVPEIFNGIEKSIEMSNMALGKTGERYVRGRQYRGSGRQWI